MKLDHLQILKWPWLPPVQSGDRLYVAAAVAAIALGVWLRLLGFFEIGLSSDEASWGGLLINGKAGWLRPRGYMELTRLLLQIVNTEQMLRSLSYVAGIAQLPLCFIALRRLVAQRWFAVAGVYALAIHPVAVGMTKEFKPYATEAMLHTLLVALALSYTASPRLRAIIGVAVTSAIGPLFAWTIVFAYPGIFSVIGLEAFLRRRFGELKVAATCVLFTLGALLMVYWLVLEKRTITTTFWAKKYGVFSLDEDLSSKLSWMLDKTFELGTFPAHLELFWPIDEGFIGALAALGCAVGAVAIIAKRDWRAGCVLIAPWLVTIVFHLLGMWPYGIFRTNVFLIFYAIALLVYAADALHTFALRHLPRARFAVAWLVGIIALIVFPLDMSPFTVKNIKSISAGSSVPAAMEKLYQLEQNATGKPKQLLLDGHACSIANYYLKYHRRTSPRYRSFFEQRFKTECSSHSSRAFTNAIARRHGKSYWLISARRNSPRIVRKAVLPHCEATDGWEFPGDTLLLYCQVSKSGVRPNVLLITLDAVRPDHLGAYGYARDTSPNIDQIAKEGSLFEVAYGAMGSSGPSHATLFTSRYPLAHGVVRNGIPLAEEEVTLAEVMQRNGYQTAAFVSADPVSRASGFAQGFDHFEEIFRLPAAYTAFTALTWLRTAWRNQPIFLWVHLSEPHFPYRPTKREVPHVPDFDPAGVPEPSVSWANMPEMEQVATMYDQEIWFADQQVGSLVKSFDRRYSAPTFVVIASSHGEGLMEHDWMEHDRFLYEEEVRVALILRWRGRIPAKTRSQQHAHLIDVFPTMVRAIGLDVGQESLDGINLLPVVLGEAAPELRPIWLQRPDYPEGRPELEQLGQGFGIRTGEWKYIEAKAEDRRELYHLNRDPQEYHDLAPKQKELVDKFSERIEKWRLSEEARGRRPARALEHRNQLRDSGRPQDSR